MEKGVINVGNRYVSVSITALTKAVSQKGFGMPLILSTSGSMEYTEYRGIEEVAEDFNADTKEYKQASALLGQDPKPEKIAIYGTAYDPGGGNAPSDLVDSLNSLIVDHNDFYFLVCPENEIDEVQALSDWINTQKKMYFVSTDDITVYQQTLNSDRTVVFVTKQPEECPAEAWVGACAPYDPGSITWTFKELNGISNAGFETTDINAIEEANGNTYIREGGVLLTSTSKTTSGEYIDIVRSKDWLEARITESVFFLLKNSKKVPFTSAGIAQVVAAVEGPIKRGANQGIIAKDENDKAMYSVTAPRRSEVAPNDRALRQLPGVKFNGVIAGAIEDVGIVGEVTI